MVQLKFQTKVTRVQLRNQPLHKHINVVPKSVSQIRFYRLTHHFKSCI